VIRQNDIIKFIIPLLEDEAEDVRVQTLETLCSLIHQNRENTQICQELSVDKIVAKRLSENAAEENQNEVDLCNNLLNLLKLP